MEREEALLSWLTSAAAKPPSEAAAIESNDPVMSESYPALHEFLTVKRKPGGGSRQTSTLLLLAEDGQWKVCLNDRDACASLWATGISAGDAMAKLEAALQGGSPSWRRWPESNGRTKK
jgi:hypothetical protein